MKQSQKLANLAELSNQLAQNNARIRNFVDQLCTRIDQIVDAATEGDWDEVVIGEYPSKTEAFRMQTLDGYADINVHREAALANVMTLSFSQAAFDRLAIPDAWINRR